MKRVKNFILVVLLSIWIVDMFPNNSFAMEMNVVERGTDTTRSSNVHVIQKAVIITKYRMYKGKLQYRRWNSTTGTWVDPCWIDA